MAGEPSSEFPNESTADSKIPGLYQWQNFVGRLEYRGVLINVAVPRRELAFPHPCVFRGEMGQQVSVDSVYVCCKFRVGASQCLGNELSELRVHVVHRSVAQDGGRGRFEGGHMAVLRYPAPGATNGSPSNRRASCCR